MFLSYGRRRREAPNAPYAVYYVAINKRPNRQGQDDFMAITMATAVAHSAVWRRAQQEHNTTYKAWCVSGKYAATIVVEDISERSNHRRLLLATNSNCKESIYSIRKGLHNNTHQRRWIYIFFVMNWSINCLLINWLINRSIYWFCIIFVSVFASRQATLAASFRSLFHEWFILRTETNMPLLSSRYMNYSEGFNKTELVERMYFVPGFPKLSRVHASLVRNQSNESIDQN